MVMDNFHGERGDRNLLFDMVVEANTEYLQNDSVS